MSDAGDMTHDEMTHDYAADEMVAAADSDQGDADEMTHDGDKMTHDYAADEMIYNTDGDGVAAIHSSNNIESNCMDSHICSKQHHGMALYQKARCMNSMSSTPTKQSKSFSYLLLFYVLSGSARISLLLKITNLTAISKK
jgi:hypothetical protein